MREVLVLIHASAGVAGLVAGLPLISPPNEPQTMRRLRMIYLSLLIILFLSLIWLVILDWGGLNLAARLTFSGLALLAGVMVYRMIRAARLADTRTPHWAERYVSHVYFTYISLWVGFAIVPAIGSNNPAIWIPIAVVGVLLVGGIAINRYKRRIGLST